MDDHGHEIITRGACRGLMEFLQIVLTGNGVEQTNRLQKEIEKMRSTIVTANIDEDRNQSCSAIHFDNCAFSQGVQKINRNLRNVYSSINRFSPIAFAELGRALHTIQDFYAHSNWVEIYQDHEPIPIWDLRIESLPQGIQSGTYTAGSPKACASPSASHEQMNKDNSSSARGSVRVSQGPNRGLSFFDLACDVATRATAMEIAKFLRGVYLYQVTTKTGTEKDAGTDADVFIELWENESQSTGWIYLDNMTQNDFENGQTDPFLVGILRDIKSIAKVRIGYPLNGHLGRGPGWFLENVEVKNVAGNMDWSFSCNRWVARDELDGKTTVDLVPDAKGVA